MVLPDKQFLELQNNTVSTVLLSKCGLHDNYYMSPFLYIRDKLHLQLTCTGIEWKEAVEMANDEDIAPHDASLPVIVDGILAYIFSDYLEAVGIDLISYFTYRFFPPNPEFQDKLDKFEELINAHKVVVS